MEDVAGNGGARRPAKPNGTAMLKSCAARRDIPSTRWPGHALVAVRSSSFATCRAAAGVGPRSRNTWRTCTTASPIMPSPLRLGAERCRHLAQPGVAVREVGFQVVALGPFVPGFQKTAIAGPAAGPAARRRRRRAGGGTGAACAAGQHYAVGAGARRVVPGSRPARARPTGSGSPPGGPSVAWRGGPPQGRSQGVAPLRGRRKGAPILDPAHPAKPDGIAAGTEKRHSAEPRNDRRGAASHSVGRCARNRAVIGHTIFWCSDQRWRIVCTSSSHCWMESPLRPFTLLPAVPARRVHCHSIDYRLPMSCA